MAAHTSALLQPQPATTTGATQPRFASDLSARVVRTVPGSGGVGVINGTVKIKGTPDFPTARKVLLLREPGAQVVASTISNPLTGEYRFEGLSLTQRYTALAYDHEHNFRAVVADNLTPEAS